MDSLGTFLCPFYSVSATASATVNYATCNVGLCGGDTVTMGVCSNGGSFTGGVHLLLVIIVSLVLLLSFQTRVARFFYDLRLFRYNKL